MLELSRALGRGAIAVPEGATLQGPDGRHYSKNAAGQAVLALPLVAIGEAASRLAGLPSRTRALAVRAVASFFNAAVTAILLAGFYLLARWLGIGVVAAVAATLGLGFTTPLWVYAKSFMAEPLQALGLLAAVVGAARARTPQGATLAAVGIALAVSVKLSMLPLVLPCLIGFAIQRPVLPLVPWIGLAAALGGHVGYNLVRFGSLWETGYGAQATVSAYTTPLLVGLYGLLFSSGKGVAWFAPLVWLAPAGWVAAWRGGRATENAESTPARAARAAASIGLVVWLVALLLYARFQHWAGDGSFGPRYLVPALPIAFLFVAFALDRASRVRRAIAVGLAVVGLLVQVGGVAIYFGAQMREAGDYPYTLPLDHPRFMHDSHFNPAFSPIAGHWRMLCRNLSEHLRGEAPRVAEGGVVDPRIGVSPENQRQLLHGLDFWWLYVGYVGMPRAPAYAAVLGLLAVLIWALMRLAAAARAEARA